MSRFGRIHPRPDAWSSPHERARARAAERLDGPLGLAEATWLDEHLAACPECAAVAAAYEADRAALRSLRDMPVEPPRDLWARTAAAIDVEAGAGRPPRLAPAPGRRLPVALLSGAAVIIVVIGVSALSGGFLGGPDGSVAMIGVPTPTPATAPTPGANSTVATVAATPFSVGAGDVAWVERDADGSLAYKAAPIRKVCPVDRAEDCATLDDAGSDRLALGASPHVVISSPTKQQAILVTDDGTGGQQVEVVSLPAKATPTPAPSATATATSPPTASATPSPEPSSASPTATSSQPPVGDTVPDVTPSATTATETPSAAPATPIPTVTALPTETPVPTIAARLAIASDVVVADDAAAFSSDGEWFAFTARPADGSGGPDVYVWHVGEAKAKRLTTDGSSVFASWEDGVLVVSRADPATSGASEPVTVRIIPKTGREFAAGDLWRPVVDPTGARAVAWVGTVAPTQDGHGVTPAVGRLELRDWSADTGATIDAGTGQPLSDATPGDFDVRWDETGTWFAVWIGHPGSDTGRLTLYHVDPATGSAERPQGAPVDVHALPGFSIGQGRLAWATPPGQGGEGSRVQVVAWTNDGVGTVETAPGEDPIVVR